MFILSDLNALKEEIILIRRYLHEHPEIGFDVSRTHDFIKQYLRDLNLTIHEHVNKNSIIGVFENQEGPSIAFRSDMDALPIQEQNEIDYISKSPGLMHACGHDAHMAILLITAKFCSSHPDLFRGKIFFVFQEAEEGPNPGGAKGVIESGLLEEVSSFYAFHVWPTLPAHTFGIKSGAMMASVDIFDLIIHGKSSHAAYPQMGINATVIASVIVTKLDELFHQIKNQAVLTVTQIHSGNTHNVISDFAQIQGTVRTFSFELRDQIKFEIEKIAQTVCEEYKASYEFQYSYEYDPTINAISETHDFERSITSSFGTEALIQLESPSFAAEDFSRYIKYRKGAICFIGINKDQNTSFPLHHPLFNLDEDVLLEAVLVNLNIIGAYR